MSDTRSLGRAALAVALASTVAVSCGSDVIDLLPAISPGGSGGAAGTSGTGTSGMGATLSAAGMTSGAGTRNEAGSSSPSQGGVGGAFATGGDGGTASGGCAGFGFGCGDGGENPGFGGSFGGPFCPFGPCTPCTSDAQCSSPYQPHCSRALGNVCVQCAENGKGECKPGESCDLAIGRCSQSCKSSAECFDGRVCDTTQDICVACFDNQQCETNPNAHICSPRGCVQCLGDADCTQGDRHRCANLECVQCISDKDCTGANGATGHCDTAHVRCL